MLHQTFVGPDGLWLKRAVLNIVGWFEWSGLTHQMPVAPLLSWAVTETALRMLCP